MKKIICIGECSLNMVLDAAGKPLGSMMGGRVANAAAILAREGLNVFMATDVCADPLGDILVKELSDAGVDVSSVDRPTVGITPANIFVTADEGMKVCRHVFYPLDAFDIIWPRVDEDDIILFGGYYAINPCMRQRLVQFLEHAKERKAILVYLPGFMPEQESRITRVMPHLLENFEFADVLVTRNRDLELIFGVKTPDVCYNKHIDFYCRSLVNIDPECSKICYYSGKEFSSVDIPAGVCSSLLWNSGAVAGLVSAILAEGLKAPQLDTPAANLREKMLNAAASTAMQVAKALNDKWQLIE